MTETRTFLLIVSLCLFQLIFPSYAVAQDILYREVRSSSEDHKFKLLDMTQHFFIRKVNISRLVAKTGTTKYTFILISKLI